VDFFKGTGGRSRVLIAVWEETDVKEVAWDIMLARAEDILDPELRVEMDRWASRPP
jgi:hypothetical protein